MGPLSWLWLTSKMLSAVSPASAGMGPLSWLWLTSKMYSAVSPASAGTETVS